MRIFIYTISILLYTSLAWSQDKIQLERADKLKGGVFEGHKINKVIGNVKFKHDNAILYCDSAYQFLSMNKIEAFGSVRIIQADSIFLNGNHLKYNGDTRIAKMKGDVTLSDPTMTLESNMLDYNLNTEEGYYNGNGKIRQKDGAVLTSVQGWYNVRTSIYNFRDKVVLINDEYTLLSDTLVYNTKSEVATFVGPSTLKSDDQYLYAEKGWFNSGTNVSKISGRAEIKTKDYQLNGDKLWYDQNTGDGTVFGHAIITYFKDSLTVMGDSVVKTGSTFSTKVFGHAHFREVANNDTLFIDADTILSINDTIRDINQTYAYRHVKLYRGGVEAVCDSLFYSVKDSIIKFIGAPVVWNGDNQITADSISLFLNGNEIDRMEATISAYIVSALKNENFNQVKGKKMIAYFQDGEIDRVEVIGNGESIYFADNDKEEMIGMNRVICSKMLINFDLNEVSDITFLTQPESVFIPPQNIQGPEKRLKGFQWLVDQRPQRMDFQP